MAAVPCRRLIFPRCLTDRGAGFGQRLVKLVTDPNGEITAIAPYTANIDMRPTDAGSRL